MDRSASPAKESKMKRAVRASVLRDINADAASFAGKQIAARRTPSPKKDRKPKAGGTKSPSPIKVKITRSAFAKIELAKKKNAEDGGDKPAKL